MKPANVIPKKKLPLAKNVSIKIDEQTVKVRKYTEALKTAFNLK
jgi:hypothetical protein